MQLTKTQSTHYFTNECGDKLILRNILPSAPYGAWVGNTTTIHVWSILKVADGSALYATPTDEELQLFETALGEWDEYTLIDHIGLGRVVAKGFLFKGELHPAF